MAYMREKYGKWKEERVLISALRKKMEKKANKECEKYVTKYAECSTGRTISLLVRCRQEFKEKNNCLHIFANDAVLEKMKKEHMLQQERNGSTRS